MTRTTSAGRVALLAFLCIALGDAGRTLDAGEILTTSDIENLCRHAADDAKKFLHVAEEEGKKYRESLTVWVLGIDNLSESCRFSQDEATEDERRHQLSMKLGRALAAPGRIRTEHFSVYAARPDSELWQSLTAMLKDPREKWIDEKTRIKNGIGWIVYGYLLDVPGRKKPYAVFKMADVRTRLLVWGGCFAMDPTQPGHRDEVLYPSCKRIVASLEVPSWAEPKAGATMSGTYWDPPASADSGAESEETIFGDLLTVEFLRAQSKLAYCQWLDPTLVKRAAAPIDSGAKEGSQPGAGFRVLADLHAQEDWQRPEAFVTGQVELERPKVKSALLKCVKLMPAEDEKASPQAYVLSGYCSETGDYAARRDWARRTVEIGLRSPGQETRTLRVADTFAFADREQFRDIVEIAIAQPEIPGCRVLEGRWSETGQPDLSVLSFTDENVPARSLYMFIQDAKTGRLLWGRNQKRPSGEALDSSYRQYAIKMQVSIRGGASQYGRQPALLWHLRSGELAEETVGTWDVDTVGQELAVSLIDPSRPFIVAVGDRLFGAGGYKELIGVTDALQKASKEPLRVIAFQLLARGDSERPVLVAKYLDPATGMIDWAYYDEPPGTPLTNGEEDELLDKVRSSVEGISKIAATEEPLAALVGRLEENQLLSLGKRPYEMLVTQLAVRRQRPPIEWDYLVARGVCPPDKPQESVFSADVHEKLTDLAVASVVQGEWLPAHIAPERHPEVKPRQFLLWESSPYELAVEKFGAAPATDAVVDPSSVRSLGLCFLHRLAKVFMKGAENTQEWESIDELKGKAPLLRDVLSFVLKDYELDAGLTQNIVIQEGAGKWQLASRGTKEDTATAATGFPGFLADPTLPNTDRETVLVAVREIRLQHGKQKQSAATGTSISRLYPPDWRDEHPDGRPLLDVPDRIAVSILRRNLEYWLRREGFMVADAAGLRARSKVEPDPEAMDRVAVKTDMVAKLGEEMELRTVQISLTLRDLRAFVLEGTAGDTNLVYSLTVSPAAEVIHPQNQMFGSLPDSFRFFLIQKAPTGAEGLKKGVGSQLAEAWKQDLKKASDLWAAGDRDEARQFRDRLMGDLATWAKGFSALEKDIAANMAALADLTIQQEAEEVRRLRAKVTSGTDRNTLEAARAQATALLKLLGDWGTAQATLGDKAGSAALQLAEDTTAAQEKMIVSLLGNVARNGDPHAQNDAYTKVAAARFLADELITDLGNWAKHNAAITIVLGDRVAKLAEQFVTTHKTWGNALFPAARDLPRKERKLEAAVLTSLKDAIETCQKDLAEWSRAFPGLKTILTRENARTPKWDYKDWRRSRPVVPKTLRDAATALADELD